MSGVPCEAASSPKRRPLPHTRRALIKSRSASSAQQVRVCLLVDCCLPPTRARSRPHRSTRFTRSPRPALASSRVDSLARFPLRRLDARQPRWPTVRDRCDARARLTLLSLQARRSQGGQSSASVLLSGLRLRWLAASRLDAIRADSRRFASIGRETFSLLSRVVCMRANAPGMVSGRLGSQNAQNRRFFDLWLPRALCSRSARILTRCSSSWPLIR